ncbi:MAG: hypothetical protein ACR2G7_07340 [Acidimicrobiales bacterium]
MLRRLFRSLVKLALLGAVVAAVSKLLQRRQLEPLAPVATGPWPPLDVERPAPIPHEPSVDEPSVDEPLVDAEPVDEPLVDAEPVDEPLVDAEPVEVEPVEVEPVVAEGSLPWVEPDDGECRASHPIKAKLSSGVFHLPGMMHYDRTNADRCYPDAAAAEADGLRQAKR